MRGCARAQPAATGRTSSTQKPSAARAILWARRAEGRSGQENLFALRRCGHDQARAPTNMAAKRHRGVSNPCGQSPMDFESISLAARTQCHASSAYIASYMVHACIHAEAGDYDAPRIAVLQLARPPLRLLRLRGHCRLHCSCSQRRPHRAKGAWSARAGGHVDRVTYAISTRRQA